MFMVRVSNAKDIEFNVDVLDVKDRSNYNLKNFSRGNYVIPGDYTLLVKINSRALPEQSVNYYLSDDPASQESQVCITPELLDKFGLKPDIQEKLTWWHKNQCLNIGSLKGLTAEGSLSTQSLNITIPQAYLEYTSENWDPPSQWDNGIPGLLFDYNVNTQVQRQQQDDSQSVDVSGNGTLGGNLGAWRLRADWQTNYTNTDSQGDSERKNLDFSRYYAYRALPHMGAKITMGEDYLRSDIFDSFRFAGASLATDDSMLPPNLRGYAPEVTGTANTNAKVTISQQGRVLYEEQVAAGPFRIQDINNAVSGKLDVRVEEQDGRVQTYQMDTASIPYLTRPGTVRYKLAMGRPTDENHSVNGSVFASGEGSWGVSNGWSLYGGGVGNDGYRALSLGIGRDLMAFGAVSFDVTNSRAQIDEGSLTGNSYRVSYSKNFDEYDSQITFAGYRFSEKNYMSMNEYLDVINSGGLLDSSYDSGKEMYTITFNKQFVDAGLSVYLNYNHQTYWDAPVQERYSLTMSRYFDFRQFKNMSLSLSAYRNDYNDTSDDGMYLSLSVPWGSNGTLSYNGTFDHQENMQQASYFGQLEGRDSYNISAGEGRSGGTVSGYYSRQTDMADINMNASYQESRYSALSMNLQGGATATLEGAALHRAGMLGGTRMLLDTEGVADVPISGNTAHSNGFGKVVVADVNSYNRNSFNIDVNALPDNAEATNSVVEATMTEGAIGYRKFSVISGEKAMASIRMADGSVPPFGATVTNAKGQSVGIVGEDGSVYLNGIKADEHMAVNWDGNDQCELVLPQQHSGTSPDSLLLPCRPLSNIGQHATAAQ